MAAQGVLTALRAVSVVAVVGEGVETVAGGGEDGGAAADEAPAGAHHGGGDDVGHGERAGGAAVLLHGVLVVLVVVDELHILVRRRRPPHRRHHEWSERMGKRVCTDTRLPPLPKQLRKRLESLDSMAASASSPAASASSSSPIGAKDTASTTAFRCPICLESFKDEAYLDTCFRKISRIFP
nr:unnamed protein product [Digitaria exilis]